MTEGTMNDPENYRLGTGDHKHDDATTKPLLYEP
jgi:hypothetical protein